MIKYFAISFFKKIWVLNNNKSQMFLSLFSNITILLIMYYTSLSNNLNSVDNNQVTILIYYYTIIFTIMSSLMFISNTIISDCRTGFIEQVLISPHGLKSSITFQVLFQSIYLIVYLSIVIGTLIAISSTTLYSLNTILSYYFVVLVGVFGLYGIGLILAAISLVSKEVYSLTTIFKLILLYLIVQLPTNAFIPFSYANHLIYEILTFQQNLMSFKWSELFFLSLNSLVYFYLGLICFSIFEKRVLKTGKYIGY